MTIPDLVQILQLAIAPMILISGVGMVMLSMNNRFGRLIDRSRQLTQSLRGVSGEERERTLAQLRILWRRAKIMRTGIALANVSALLAALLVINLFLGALFDLRIANVIVTLFVFCLLSLVSALVLFIADINLSLRAIGLELPSEARSQ